MPSADDGGLEFCLLGPLMVRRCGVPCAVQRGKQRVALAALLLKANRLVSVDELIDTLWEPARAPRSAEVTVRNYIKRLRQSLTGAGGDRISTRRAGYQIAVEPDELDISRFEVLLTAARAAARGNAWQEVSDRALAALQLWRGDPLEDIESDALSRRVVPHLAELRREAEEARILAELRLGGHASAIAGLRELLAACPLREDLYELLMLALCRCGRRSEALALYHRAWQVLGEELGIEPGARLRDLHQQILTGDLPGDAA